MKLNSLRQVGSVQEVRFELRAIMKAEGQE